MQVTTEFRAADNTWVFDVGVNRSDQDLPDDLGRTTQSVTDSGAGKVELWIHDITDAADQAARDHGFVAYRDLWQLRCALPAEPSSLTTRAFTEADTDALISVNNRAFSWHPEQSGMTRESLQRTMAEPWFNADGFRLFERGGELLGFCWTKVHFDEDPLLGEIFVIAVDPSAHGQGLGIPMTLAGLDWIHDQGIDQALLYVESDNDAANATYRKIGFFLHRTDRAYQRAIAAND